MWACQADSLPGYTWVSSSDATGFLPGWHCEPLENSSLGAGLQEWLTSWKIVRLISGEL